MTKITLSTVGSLIDATTAATTINNNFGVIKTAFDNNLSRDGTAPNTMSASLDMNSKQILNLPAPLQANSPLRLQDLSDFTGSGVVSNLPAGGTIGQVLGKHSSTDFDVAWQTKVISVALALPSEFDVTGSPVTSSGTLNAVWHTAPTGTGGVVKATSPTLVTPVLGTPTSGTLTNCTGLPVAGVSGLGTGVSTFLATPTSANLAAALTDETGSGANVFANSPTILSPTFTGSAIVSSTAGTALTVGPNGATSPVLTVDGSGSSIVSGIRIAGAATGGTVNLVATDPGANVNMRFNAKGTGSFMINDAGTGGVIFGAAGNNAKLIMTGGTSGSTTVIPTAAASGTLTLPAATDTLVGKATTDTLTNKTFAVTGAGNSLLMPYFSASLSASQATTTTTANKILCNTELADSNSWYDNATNYRFTPLLAGKYRVTAHVSGSGTSLTEIDASIFFNGSVLATSFNVSSGVTALSLAISKLVAFNGSTDYVEFFAALFGTGSLSFLGGTGPIRTWFEAQYVGA